VLRARDRSDPVVLWLSTGFQLQSTTKIGSEVQVFIIRACLAALFLRAIGNFETLLPMGARVAVDA
jgi:hypothetical protein